MIISIEARLSALSSSKSKFDEVKGHYQEVLTKNGYKHTLKYSPPAQAKNKNNRKRNVIWFNPPYSKTVETNIGKKFLALVTKHFPRGSKFYKIFNRSTLKVSYGCMANVGTVINSHNRKILGETKPLEKDGCNCERGAYRGNCPVNGECLTKNVLYRATVTSDLQNYGEKNYKGITYNTFKKRHYNHEKDFRDENNKTSSELSKEIWKIKEKGGNYRIKWKLMDPTNSTNIRR